MTHNLQPYPDYRDSGVPWFGAIPAHWNMARIKNIFQETELRSGDGSGTLLSLTRIRGLIPQAEATKRLASAEDLSKYKVCMPSNLVMNRMQAWSGMFAVSNLKGLVSPDYSVFRARVNVEISYFEHLFKTRLYVDQFAHRSKGIGTGFNRLYTPDFGAISLVLPPLDEQAAIVRFLEHTDRRVNRFVRAKRRLVALLHEQKQAIIHRAVTRGLDPDVRLKPSGVAWLGDVPEHWEVRRAKYYFCEVDERTDTGTGELLSVSHITGVTPRSQKNVTMFMAESYEGYKVCHPGDLVINIMWAWMGALGVSKYNGIISYSYGVYRQLKQNFLPEYLDLLLRTNSYISEFNLRSKGIRSSRLRMYTEDFFKVPIICPSLDEQRAIILHTQDAAAELETLITRTQREIDLIREYRTRLVADVVTGKLDVRGVALADDTPIEDDTPLDVDELTDDPDLELTGENTDADD